MIETIEKIRSEIPKIMLIIATHDKINKEIDPINFKLNAALKIICKTPAVINNVPDIIEANGLAGIVIAIKLPQNINNSNKTVAIILEFISSFVIKALPANNPIIDGNKQTMHIPNEIIPIILLAVFITSPFHCVKY